MKWLLFVALVLVAGMVVAAVRSPAVAGSFYTADPVALREEVNTLLTAAPRPERAASAVVVPHAGYVFSGATAAKGLATLAGGELERVILLGPSHHASFRGGALPEKGTSAFRTPLGEIALDTAALEDLRRLPDFGGPAAAHRPEHCLEVELPFLQMVASQAKIVPILVGLETDRGDARRMARSLAQLLTPRTAVVVSTDFTHHGAGYSWAPFAGAKDLGDRLVALARATAGRVAAIDPEGFWQQVEVSGDTVCGRRPVAVLNELLAHAFDGTGRVVDVTTSGHVSHSWDRVVSYAAVAFEGRWRAWREPASPAVEAELSAEQGKAMVALARATLTTKLGHGPELAEWFAAHGGDPALRGIAGAFVTLNNQGQRARREGRLRACMGVIEATEPAVDAVIHAAVSASRDPRFPPLELDELGEVEVEVSILSPLARVAGPEAIEVGRHGVVLSKGWRRAVFLPQVAPEQGWNRETMLDHLARKAGLPTDAWREGASFEVFTAQVFSE